MVKVLRRGLCFVGIGVALSLATSATVLADMFLPPSGTAPTPAETFRGTPLTVLDTPTISDASIYGSFGSRLRVEVVRDAGGAVEFLYHVVNSANDSTTGLVSLALADHTNANTPFEFATSSPSLAFLPISGTQGAVSSGLAVSGPPVVFDFDVLAGAPAPLAAGATSGIIQLRTNVTALNPPGSPQTSGETLGSGTHVDLNGDEVTQGSFLTPGPTLLGLKALSVSAVACFALVQRRRMAVSSF